MKDCSKSDFGEMAKSEPTRSARIVQRRSVTTITVVVPSKVTSGRPSSDRAAATS